MNIRELASFCVADHQYFDTLDAVDDGASRFPEPTDLDPALWRCQHDGVWVSVQYVDLELPVQGWKIHVSATLANASAVLETVRRYCVERLLSFKFLRSEQLLLYMNEKNCPRASSGKFITIYPRDDGEFDTTLRGLDPQLARYSGPYILGDLRHRNGPLYVRYGAFRTLWCFDERGNRTFGLKDPSGRVVPDARSASFSAPHWVKLPAVLTSDIEARRRHAGEDFPYHIQTAIQFSNGGGVYLATCVRTGKRVVVREARPHAGLDATGADAVVRLLRSKFALERLAGLSCAPRFIDYRVVGDHHYLVEEYIEGRTALNAIITGLPLVEPDTSDQTRAAYVAWADEVMTNIEVALAMVHGRGVSIGDLHPGNVIVRPDNTIALIDYELAGEGTSWSGRGLVTAGYAAPGVTAGADADWFALERMRLTMLLPLTSLVVHDASKVATLVDAATAELPVAQSTGGRLRRVAGHGCSPVAVDHAGSMFAAGETGWPAAEAAIVAAIQGSATPNRRDRLFPGDPALFATGGTDVACGAAGVLYALHRTGNPVVGEHIDWLATQALRVPDPVGGLYGGLHGTAVVLDLLGRRAQALDVLARVRGHDSCGGKAGIHSGLAGVALSLLHFASRTGDADMLGGAQILASRLADAFDGSGDHPDVRLPDRPGLMWGATGVAALFIRMFEHTGEPWYLDRAYACLCRDLAHCAPRSPGTLYVREGPRNLPHLDTGSLGLAVVASRYLRHRYTPDLAAAVAAASRACDAAVVFQSGIQQGRAGLILGLANISDAAQADTIHRHIRRLGWHALNHRDGIAFPGAQLLRLSMDLFTGSAGILLAVHAAIRGDGSFLPTLDAAEHSDPVPEGGETP